MDGLTISRAGAEAVDRLEPLWKAMHEHQTGVGPRGMLEFRTPQESWERRRRRYLEFLADPSEGFALLAERAGHLVGYAVVTIDPQEPATYAIRAPTAELESLSVIAQARGAGVGTALLERARAELRERGVTVWGLGVIVGNDAALRFYERHGLRPFMIEMVGQV